MVQMFLKISALATVAVLGVSSANAAPVVLTFDRAGSPGAQMACTGTDGGNVDRFCGHNDYIGANYGSTAQMAVSYNAGGAETSLRAYSASFYPDGGAYALNGNQFSTITFTPAAGNELSITGWSYAGGSATYVPYEFEIRDASNNLVLAHNATTAGSTVANTAYFSGPLTFSFRSASGSIVLDNLALDVRGTAVNPEPGAVPEPATWAMMIGGFGLVGGAMRRRRNMGGHATA